MITVMKRLEWDAGHRLLNHEGKCKHLHGHRYVAEIFVQAAELDDLGRVVDFGVIKEQVGGWVDLHWDHKMILHLNDPLAAHIREEGPYLLPCNPTAENLAQHLFFVAARLLQAPLAVVKVTVWETPTCHATYYPE